MTIRRRASSLFLVVVSLVAGCSDGEFPVSPTPVASADVTTVSGGTWSGSIIVTDGSTTAFNMTLIGRGLGQETGARTRQTAGTIEVTGNFATGIGLKGTIQGALQGTLQNGSFDGSLTADAPACSRRYVGPITEATVAWIPSGSPQPGCPLTFSVQLPRPRGPDCQYVVSLSRQTFSGNGGSGELRITTGAACTWAAESLDSWLEVEDPAPKIGSGRVAFTARPNQQDARQGRLRVAIASQTFMIAQGPPCTYAVSPGTVVLPAAGGTSAISVTAPAECEWSAQSSVPWLTVAPARGSGSGTVTLTAQSSGGPSRAGTASVAGETIAVSQGEGCDVTVTPATVAAPAAGRSGTLQVSAATGCSWTAQANVPWIVLAPSGGNGPGVVNFTVQAHTGSERQGTINVAGRTVAVSQGEGCDVAVTPATVAAPAAGRSGTLQVSAATGCPWTTQTSVPWIVLTPAGGNGPGVVNFTVQANTGSERSGTISVAGRTVAVTQASGCTYTVNSTQPPSLPSNESKNAVTVTTNDGCRWEATIEAGGSWLSFPGTAGTVSRVGTSTFTFLAAENDTSDTREGRIKVTGDGAISITIVIRQLEVQD